MKISSLGALASLVFLITNHVSATVSKRASSLSEKMEFEDKFRQLEEVLPTANDYRTASGAPGHKYWQQRVDYKMDVTLDPSSYRVSGVETITYHNNSPDSLYYLWLHIESNARQPDSQRSLASSGLRDPKVSYRGLQYLLANEEFDAEYKIESVIDDRGRKIPFTVNETMLRLDFSRPIRPTRKQEFTIKWSYKLHEQKLLGGRSGYEFFEDEKNHIFQMAIFYPRLAAYSDAEGWHNKQFLGGGEFTLEFGNYDVAISVPDTHVVAATGTLINSSKVLTSKQIKRLGEAKESDRPIYIISPEEAIANEGQQAKGTKTWRFKADKVRDFAFASSPKFIWDAQGVKSGDRTVLAMSYYPIAATPLWNKYSTHAIAHTIEEYNKYTFDYPYPVAISVNGPVGGMEYPMISFNGPRPVKDEKTGQKTYSRRTKYGLISVIIHEVGHNYFPMIVNSDERQWTWMDEGINTFVQFLAEQTWEENYPSRRGEPRNIIEYMANSEQVPIMTNSESLWQFGNNAYGKPATALNILRETILGRELFDFAFREYARRWKFKRPMPADFFRTMEDASGVDLDWFWRGWFYSTDHVDISLEEIHHYTLNTKNMELERAFEKGQKEAEPRSITQQRNAHMNRRINRFPELADFYNEYDEFTVTGNDRDEFQDLLKKLKPSEKLALQSKSHFYQFHFVNKGGLVMPIIFQVEYESGKKELLRIPAEIWRKSPRRVTKMIVSEERILSAQVDPFWETADVDTYNNHFPRKPYESRIDVFKRKKSRNLMKEMVDSEKKQQEKVTQKVESH